MNSIVRFVLLGFWQQGYKINVDMLVPIIEAKLLSDAVTTRKYTQVIRDSSTGTVIEVYVKRGVH